MLATSSELPGLLVELVEGETAIMNLAPDA
jgi:hypothetical protein